jgi:hypothetical protein
MYQWKCWFNQENLKKTSDFPIRILVEPRKMMVYHGVTRLRVELRKMVVELGDIIPKCLAWRQVLMDSCFPCFLHVCKAIIGAIKPFPNRWFVTLFWPHNTGFRCVFTTNDRGFEQILPLHVMEHVDKGPKDTPELSRHPKKTGARTRSWRHGLTDCILINTYYPLVMTNIAIENGHL